MAAHTGSRCNPSTSTTRRARPLVSSAVAPRRPSPTKPTNNVAGDSKARTRRRDMEVRRKMEALRRLVPSGDGDGDEVDELLLRAAGYIARLQAQVTVMQLMVDVLEHA
ncbi:transcription factor IBH1-like [Phragmites australis]|uniref:transcription factor IBH1-like n=1 Tax=Phragmites australis TaxID=29695 RepID=UPI002D795B08|nr:transcription factor IBH1-like [Phragmites australis]